MVYLLCFIKKDPMPQKFLEMEVHFEVFSL